MDVHGCNDVIIPMGKTAQHANTFRSDEHWNEVWVGF